jgi:hypothetical protein
MHDPERYKKPKRELEADLQTAASLVKFAKTPKARA